MKEVYKNKVCSWLFTSTFTVYVIVAIVAASIDSFLVFPALYIAHLSLEVSKNLERKKGCF